MPRPISVVLPDEMRARLKKQADRRALKLSSTIRFLLVERLCQLEAEEDVTRAEEWQRAQAWASWDRLQHEGASEVSWGKITDLFDEALGRRRAR